MNSSVEIVYIPKKKIKELSGYSFEVKIKGKIFRGFVVCKNGKFYAYQNLCLHLPVTLDLEDSQFFTHDKDFLQCHMHGAMYEIETGFCVGGPCPGTRLIHLPLQEDEHRLVIKIPHHLAKDDL